MVRLSIRDTMRNNLSEKILFEEAKVYAFDYMDTIDDRSVYPSCDAVNGLEVFNEPMPDCGTDPSELLKMLHEYGSPATVAQTGGRYFGFVNGGAIPVTVAAKWLSDVWDQNSALHVISPVAAKLEQICEDWLKELLGLPECTSAGFVSGSSVAILCGLAAGRNELLRKSGWDIYEKGLFGAPRIRVVLGEQAHASVFKALSVLGIGRESIEKAPVDEQGRILADKLPEIDEKTLLILQAGNVSTGSFDPIDQICKIACPKGAWIHIDGAFGLWASASEAKRSLTAGLDKADSWSVDAHKTLNTPYDCGIILCKSREALVGALQSSGAYIQYSESRDGMLYTPEMSRRARSIELWAALKFLGRQGVEELIDSLCNLAQMVSQKLCQNGFTILNDVVFNQVLVTCDTPEETKSTLMNLQNSGECWCGGTVWNNEPAIRISICSWSTTSADIDRSISAFIKARDMAKQ